MDLQKLGKQELEELLSSLRLYRDLGKKLGKRGTELFKRKLSGEQLLVVEYFPSISEDFAYSNASQVYSKVFSLTPKKEEIHFIEKDSLLGGMKIYKDDSMIDLSFSKVEGLLKK